MKKIIFFCIIFVLVVCPNPVPYAENRTDAPTRDTMEQPPFFGHYHALIIGIDNYKEWPPLKTAVRDAEAIKEILVRRYGFGADDVILRTNRNAERRTIINDLRKLATRLGNQDNLFIYFAGHGRLDDLTGDGYWIPVDGALKDPGTWLSHAYIKSILGSKKVKCKNIVVVADSCYAGSLFQESTSLLPLSDADYREKLIGRAALRSRQVITTGGFKPFTDGPRSGHSLFGDFFFNALHDNTRAVIDIENLCRPILVENVQKISGHRPHMGRFKTDMDQGGQFVLFDREKFIADEQKRAAEERERQEQAELQTIQEERKKLADERRRFEEDKKALEEKKEREAERIKIEKEMAENQRLAEERRKEQEQMEALLEERKKIEDERRRLEAEKKALEEKKKREAERIKAEKEKLALAKKKEEETRLAALREERKKLEAERQRIEAEKKSLKKDISGTGKTETSREDKKTSVKQKQLLASIPKDRIRPDTDVFKLAIFPFRTVDKIKWPGYFASSITYLWIGTINAINNYKNIELRFSYHDREEIERSSDIQFIDSIINQDTEKKMWRRKSPTSPLEPHFDLVYEYGEIIGADLVLMSRFEFRGKAPSYLIFYLIDINNKTAYKKYNLIDDFYFGADGDAETMTLANKLFDEYLKGATGKGPPQEKKPLAKDRSGPGKMDTLKEEKQLLASIPKDQTVPGVVLRSKKSMITSTQHIKDLLIRHNFFDSRMNENGDFNNNFVDNGDNTITDATTGLMWQKGGTDKKVGNIHNARKYIQKLNDEKFVGHSDWRIPTLEELASLSERTKNSKGLFIGALFEDLSPLGSSDYFPYGTEEMPWLIDYENGRITHVRVTMHSIGRGIVSSLASDFTNQKNLYYIKAVRSISDQYQTRFSLDDHKRVAAIPEERSPKITLRSKKRLFKFGRVDQSLRSIKVLDYEKVNFFDAKWNKNGNVDNHFVDNGDGTITDRTTNLMWEKGCSGKKGRRHPRTGYVKKLNRERFAGYTDWRVPTLEELASLLEPKKNRDGIHIDPLFSKTEACASADSYFSIHATQISLTVNFENGEVVSPTAVGAQGCIKAVRSIK